MQFGMREIGEPPEVRMFTKKEVDTLIGNVVSMKLPHGDPFLLMLENTTFIDLDKLFNGAKN